MKKPKCSNPPHHWVIEPPNGGKVTGICKKCDKSYKFNPNAFEESREEYYQTGRQNNQAQASGQRANERVHTAHKKALGALGRGGW